MGEDEKGNAMSRISPSYVTGLEKYINELRNQVSSLKAELSTIRRIHAQNIALKDAEIARWKTVPMKYRRMEFNAQLQFEIAEQRADHMKLVEENHELRQQLAALKAELREICAAIDDPACDLTLTAVECIKRLKADNESLKLDAEQRVAEACFKLCMDAVTKSKSSLFRSGAIIVAGEIKNGEWRKFVKEV